MSQVPAEARKRQPRRRAESRLTMDAHDIAREVCGTEDVNAVGRMMAADATFPQPFRPFGKARGVRRWLRAKIEIWLRHKHRQAQRGTAA